MKPGSVIIDVAVDQGGSVETADLVTTHSNPTYVRHGVIHYAVPNMPGAVPRTATFALTNVTISYVLELAEKGCGNALSLNPSLACGVNMINGCCTHRAVAEALGEEYVPLEEALKS